MLHLYRLHIYPLTKKPFTLSIFLLCAVHQHSTNTSYNINRQITSFKSSSLPPSLQPSSTFLATSFTDSFPLLFLPTLCPIFILHIKVMKLVALNYLQIINNIHVSCMCMCVFVVSHKYIKWTASP